MAALVELPWVCADERLLFILDGQDAVADCEALEREFHQRASALLGDDFEVISFAPDHHTQRDKSAEAAALRRQRYGGRQFQRTGHGDRLMLVARCLDRGAGAF